MEGYGPKKMWEDLSMVQKPCSKGRREPFVTFSIPRKEKLSIKTEEKLVRREAASPYM